MPTSLVAILLYQNSKTSVPVGLCIMVHCVGNYGLNEMSSIIMLKCVRDVSES